jgi:hypothetical protein
MQVLHTGRFLQNRRSPLRSRHIESADRIATLDFIEMAGAADAVFHSILALL